MCILYRLYKGSCKVVEAGPRRVAITLVKSEIFPDPKPQRLMIQICITFRTLNYGNYGIFLIMGNKGFISSALVRVYWQIWTCLRFVCGLWGPFRVEFLRSADHCLKAACSKDAIVHSRTGRDPRKYCS